MNAKKSAKATKATKSKPAAKAATAKASKPEEKSTETAKPVEKAKAAKPAEQSAATDKPAAKPAAKKDGLRKPQIRILAALKKAGKELTRKEISEKAPVDNAFCTEYLGASDPARRAKNDAKFPSLLTLKFIKAETEGTVATYTITAAGIKALETAKAE